MRHMTTKGWSKCAAATNLLKADFVAQNWKIFKPIQYTYKRFQRAVFIKGSVDLQHFIRDSVLGQANF